jgi:glycerate kinase
VVADAQGLTGAVERADLVVTGEGFLDRQSFEGKVVGGVLERSRRVARPVLLVVGGADGDLLTGDPGARRLVERPETPVVSLVEVVGRDRAFHQVLAGVEDAVVGHLAALPR